MKLTVLAALLTLLLGAVRSRPAFGQRDNNNNYIDSLQAWSLHFQTTNVLQGHTGFRGAGYEGRNTMSARADSALSVTATLFVGRSLWRGAALYFNPEIAGGLGVGHRDPLRPYDETLYNPAVGAAGFPNGETFRIGSPRPALYVARLYIEQVIPLASNEEADEILSETNQVKQRLPRSRVVLTVGKFSLADMFDNNAYAHDPRTHFLNWALMSQGAWDYAANTRGYTYSLTAEYIRPTHAIRLAGALMPKTANGNVLDWNIRRSGSINVELEHEVRVLTRPGRVRVLAYRNVTKAPTYREAISRLQGDNPDTTFVGRGAQYGGVKYGFGINIEQPFSEQGGLFSRISWNDGRTATWAFTEIDRSYTLGINQGGQSWRRFNDVVGVAFVRNDLSPDHRAFLAAGGYGFIVGDGRLPNYQSEMIMEAFYKARIARTLFITADYQRIQHPGYNGDRGPVHLFALRTHIEF